MKVVVFLAIFATVAADYGYYGGSHKHVPYASPIYVPATTYNKKTVSEGTESLAYYSSKEMNKYTPAHIIVPAYTSERIVPVYDVQEEVYDAPVAYAHKTSAYGKVVPLGYRGY